MRKRQILNGLIYIVFTIALTWRIPVSDDIRFNMGKTFIWISVFTFGFYISTINAWIGIFLIYSVVNANINQSPESGAALLMVILSCMLFFVVFKMFDKKAIVTLFILFAVANFIFISCQLLGYDVAMELDKSLFLSDKQLRMGILDNRNSLSIAFAATLPVFFANKKLMVGIPLILLGLVMAKTVGGVLSTIPTFLYYANSYFNKKCLIILIIIAVAFIAAYIRFVDNPNYKSRLAVWKKYGEISQSPVVLINHEDKYRVIDNSTWFGVGLGHWKPAFNLTDIDTGRCYICEDIANEIGSKRPVHFSQAHNEFIQARFETGRIGIAFIICYLLSVLYRSSKMKDHTPILILLAFIVDAMVYFPFHIPLLAIAVIIAMAWIERECCLKRAYSLSV